MSGKGVGENTRGKDKIRNASLNFESKSDCSSHAVVLGSGCSYVQRSVFATAHNFAPMADFSIVTAAEASGYCII